MAEAGYRFGGVMGGETAMGGSEVLIVILKDGTPGRHGYLLLVTSKTSTLQKELQEAGNAGYQYCRQTDPTAQSAE